MDVDSSDGWFVSEIGKRGLNSYGIDLDPFGIRSRHQDGQHKKEQIIHSDIAIGLEGMVFEKGFSISPPV
ncbi:MAG: hypothetical protein LBI30_02705 [Holosporales bacterium]|jgi:hypothetical protein|nr:hypothetical protein [Holosporales bacterium]